LPNRSCKAAQPLTQPGTLQASGLRVGISLRPRSRAFSGEEIASRSAAHGLDQREHGVGGKGGVDGASAGLENIEAGHARQRLAGADHAVARDDGRAVLIPAGQQAAVQCRARRRCLTCLTRAFTGVQGKKRRGADAAEELQKCASFHNPMPPSLRGSSAIAIRTKDRNPYKAVRNRRPL